MVWQSDEIFQINKTIGMNKQEYNHKHHSQNDMQEHMEKRL